MYVLDAFQVRHILYFILLVLVELDQINEAGGQPYSQLGPLSVRQLVLGVAFSSDLGAQEITRVQENITIL